MQSWQPNLAWGSVPSSTQRQRAYLAMLVYLSLCGIALAVVVYQSAFRLMDTYHQRRQLQVLENSFRDLYDRDEGTLLDVAKTIGDDLEQAAIQLEGLRGLADRRIEVPRIMAGLAQSLPADVRLVNFNLDRPRRTVQFDLAMPDSPDRMLDHARTLVEAWNESPLLADDLTSIRILARNIQRMGTNATVILRLEGQLGK